MSENESHFVTILLKHSENGFLGESAHGAFEIAKFHHRHGGLKIAGRMAVRPYQSCVKGCRGGLRRSRKLFSRVGKVYKSWNANDQSENEKNELPSGR